MYLHVVTYFSVCGFVLLFSHVMFFCKQKQNPPNICTITSNSKACHVPFEYCQYGFLVQPFCTALLAGNISQMFVVTFLLLFYNSWTSRY